MFLFIHCLIFLLIFVPHFLKHPGTRCGCFFAVASYYLSSKESKQFQETCYIQRIQLEGY